MSNARVAVIMGSKSDWDVMEHALSTLRELDVPYEARILSAHRTPGALESYIRSAEESGVQVIIAAAGCAAHLAGVCAGLTVMPVLGVPLAGGPLQGIDALLSTVQMPAGIPVATLAIGKAGAVNAALLATQILGVHEPSFKDAIERHRAAKAEAVLAANEEIAHV